ncbi:MAG: cupin domain-containing protein [Planctomycetes bacterium]|nr:cupin domain-containing protein [Planctomycetota bacterium]
MIIKKINDVPTQDVNMEGAKDVKVRVVLGPADGAPTFAMRVFELAPAGHTPFHTHPFEHEAIILDGDIAAVTENGEIPLDKGDVLLIAPDEKHQFKNRSDIQPASFMCLVPVAYQK